MTKVTWVSWVTRVTRVTKVTTVIAEIKNSISDIVVAVITTIAREKFPCVPTTFLSFHQSQQNIAIVVIKKKPENKKSIKTQKPSFANLVTILLYYH